MANIKSQKKRNLQNEKHRAINSRVKSSVRTADKKVLRYMESKETKDKTVLESLYKKFIRIIDTAARKGIIKKNTAARKKSRLAKKVNGTISKLA